MAELYGPVMSTVGLGLDIIGAWMLARGIIAQRKTAALLAGTKWGKNQLLEHAFLKQSRDARIGFCILSAGFLLQMIGAWMGTDRAIQFLVSL